MEMAENSISERFSELWGKMSLNQRRFVVAMQECSSKKEAAEAIDLMPDTIYRWPEYVDEAIDLLSSSVKEAAVEILASNLAKAALVKVAGLDSVDERVRQSSASEIIDRFMGRAAQPLTGADGDDLTIYVRVRDDDAD